MTISTVHQPSLLDLFKPGVELDDNIIIIGAREHNLFLFEPFLKEFAECKIFATDCETFGQNESWEALWWYKNQIRLLQIGLESGLVLVIDFGGWKDRDNWQSIKQDERVLTILPLLGQKLFDRNVAVLGANLKFDGTTYLEKFGFKLRQARDVMIISQVLWAGLGVSKAGKGEDRSSRCKLPHSLKFIAERCGIEVDKSEQTSAWGWPLSNSQLNYAAQDVRILFPVFAELRKQIDEQGLKYTAWVECNGVSAFIDMEYYGVPISIDVCKDLIASLEQKQSEQIQIFNEYFPNVSWTSNPQVLDALKTLYPDIESVSKDVLNKLDHPSAQALVKARSFNTDINYLQRCVDNCIRGSIRSVYRQIAASGNGRSSCTGDISVRRKKYPVGTQLQNPSKEIRDIFVAPEGYVFFDFDGAQMHARIATQCGNVEMLKKIFNEDFDGHSILAGKVAKLAETYWKSILSSSDPLLSVNWNQDLIADIKGKKAYTLGLDYSIKKAAIDFRNVAKTVIYSVLNGATAGRLLLAMHEAGYKWFTIDNAKEFLSYFFDLYPELKQYIDEALKKANSYDLDFSHFRDFNGKPIDGKWGLAKTLTGRQVYFKKYPNRFRPEKMEVSMTDCTASQWCPVEKNCMLHWCFDVLWKADEHPEWDFHMCNLPHDQGTFLAKEEYAEEIAPMIVNSFRDVTSKWITVIPMVEQGDLDNPMSCVKKVLTK